MLRVMQEISPLDGMYQGNLLHYFNVGQSAIRWIRLALLAAGTPDVKRILDLPCGFGRVLRVLRAEFPSAEIVACDLEREGVDFCAEVFGATPVYSVTEPEQIPLVGEFDLIWCGSLLTHLAADRWVLFLKRFESSLAAGGVVVFTTHGRGVADRMRRGDSAYGLRAEALNTVLQQFHSVGFGFQPYVDSSDSNNYGISVSSPAGYVGRFRSKRTARSCCTASRCGIGIMTLSPVCALESRRPPIPWLGGPRRADDPMMRQGVVGDVDTSEVRLDDDS